MSIDDEIKYKEESKASLKLKDEDEPSAVTLCPAKIRTRFTYEKLVSYRFTDIATQRPDCLAEEFCNEEGVWEPELWHASLSGSGGKRSRPSSRPSSPALGLKLNRKSSDAKERLKQEEQDGIILSPQRRSFGHGCQISFPQPQAPITVASEQRSTRPKSPLEKDFRERSNSDLVNGRPIAGRRRVITRPSRDSLLEQERQREKEKGFEAREPNHRYQRQGSSEREYNHRRRNEPEWLTDVPTSNLEQIELHGFGEAEEAEREEVKGESRRGKSSRRPTELDQLVASLQSSGEQQRAATPSKEFDLNDFFNFSEPISTSPAEGHDLAQSRFSHLFNAPASLDGHSSCGSSRRSSLHKDELDFLQELQGHSGSESASSTPIHGMINDMPESTPFTLLEMLQRGQENIDVANDMRKREVQQKLMEGQAKSLAEIEAGLKQESVQKRRRSSGSLPPITARKGSPAGSTEDQSAFNSFLATLSSKGTEKPAARKSPGTILFQNGPMSEVRVPSRQSPELAHLSDQYVRSELEQLHNRGISPLSRGALLDMLNTSQHSAASSESSFLQRQSPMTPEQLTGILQQQITANQRAQAANQHVLTNVVKQAVATNPDMVASIISHQHQQGGQQRAVSPQERYQQALLQQQQALLQQQQAQSPLVTSPLGFVGTQSPLTPSPLPRGIASPLGLASHLIPPLPMGVAVPPGAHQPSPIRPRIPSPQELVKHTQNILQQALIKRQLEVQREKFYARERDTRTRSPVPGTPGHAGQRRRTPPVTPTSRPSSSTLMTAFTPTSVIRRMHDRQAEAKEAGSKQSSDDSEEAQPAADRQPDTHQDMAPDGLRSPLRKPNQLDPVMSQSGHSSPMKNKESTAAGQGVGAGAGYSSPQRVGPPPSLPDGGSSELEDWGRGDATEGSKDKTVPSVTKMTNNHQPVADARTIAADGDMVPPRVDENGMGVQSRTSQPQLGSHPPGLSQQPQNDQRLTSNVPANQQPSGTTPTDIRMRFGTDDQPQQTSKPDATSRHQEMEQQSRVSRLTGAKQRGPPTPGTASLNRGQTGPEQLARGTGPQKGPMEPQQHLGPQDQLRPIMRMAAPSPRPHMMQGHPAQFPMMHPAAAAAAAQRISHGMGAPIHPAMAQQMRGMMYTVPPPRAPTVPAAVNPMAFLAMQQLNQRAVMAQMPPARSPIPSMQGLQRGMLPPQYPSQSLLHHPNSMGMSMVGPRTLPHHPQMGPTARMAHHQHGMSNDVGSSMEHQRSAMYSMSGAMPTSATSPSASSPDNPLAKWFGNDLLKHSMVQPPKVPEGLKVLSVEEIERQHQQQAVK